MLPVGISGFDAKGVTVDEREKWCQVRLSVRRAADTKAVDAVVILDSGSGITTMSLGIANKLQVSFCDAQTVRGMSHPGKPRVADGRVPATEKKTCPVQIALHSCWSLVTLKRSSFVVMPADGDIIHVEATGHRHL